MVGRLCQVFVQRKSAHVSGAEGSMRLNTMGTSSRGQKVKKKGSRGIWVDNKVISLQTLQFSSMEKELSVEVIVIYAGRIKQ